MQLQTENYVIVLFCFYFSVADNYGWQVYAIYLFLLTIWWGMVWDKGIEGEDAAACPYIHFEKAVEKTMQPLEVAIRTVGATLGGIAVFK